MKLGVDVVDEAGVQLLVWVGGWWVVGQNESNTKINSVEVEVRVELGKKEGVRKIRSNLLPSSTLTST